MPISKRFCKRALISACLSIGLSAMIARAEDARPPEKPPTPPPARGEGGRPDPAQGLRMMRERLDQLNLTDEQKKKLDEIYSSAQDDLKKADSADRQAVGKVMGDVREKVGSVLTEEQKTKMQQLRGQGGPGSGPPGGGPGAMADRLQAALDKADLSADQKEKVKPILADARKKIDELRTKLAAGERDGMREKFKAVMDDTRDKLKEILTPEQGEKVKTAMEAGRPPGGPSRPGQPRGQAPTPPPAPPTPPPAPPEK
jgi:Spy/CpxP family protein refolding chaperone